MPAFDASLVDRLERLFERARNEDRAAEMSRYMRDLFPFYGISSAPLREIARDALAGMSTPTEAQLRAVSRACWKRPEREWQYFACGYLRRHIGVASAAMLPTLEHLIRTKSWWDTVDSLASRSVGPLVRNARTLVEEMDRWIDSPNVWLARTAILHQLFYRSATDADRLFTYCLRRAGDTEFFIRKAIGWALREYSKTDDDAVRRFVQQHALELSGLSKREALKWLERGGKHPRALSKKR